MKVAIDFETYLIGADAPFPKPVCVSYHDGSNTGIIVGMGQMSKYLQGLLEKASKIIIHNVVFEAGVIYTWFPELRKLLFAAMQKGQLICTKLNEELINVTRRTPIHKFSLADLVEDYFKVDIKDTKNTPDAWRLRYSELENIPLKEWPEEAVAYAQDDSVWAYKLYHRQQYVDYKRDVRAAVLINLMGVTGITVNPERVAELEIEIYEKLEPKYEKLIALGLCERVKGKQRPKKNTKKLQEYVIERIQNPIYSAKGNVKTDSESLQKYLLETKDEVFQYFIDMNVYDKVLTTYIANLKGQTLIRSNYSVVKQTGRTSSFGTKLYPSVNIQQMPRKVPEVKWDIRNCFIPRPGFKLVSIDYSGLELAATAHQLSTIYKKSKMLETINSGDAPVDMHSKLACQIMSIKKKKLITFEEFVAHKKEEEYAFFRQVAKAPNLGFPGGIGYDTMRHLLALDGIQTKFVILQTFKDETEARSYLFRLKTEDENLRVARISRKEFALVYDELVGIKKALFNLYPELGWFLKEDHKRGLNGNIKRMKNEWEEWEDEEMYKYSVEGFNRDWCTYTAFCNGFLMQSPSAAGFKKTCSNIIEKYIDHPDINPLAEIHDELVFEVREGRYDIVDDVAEMMIDGMQSVLSKVRISVEAEMMDYWMKSGGFWSKTYWKDPNSNTLRTK